MLLVEGIKIDERVAADDVAMSVIVDNHVHLGDACNGVVDFNTKEPFLCEVVPVGVVSRSSLVVKFGCLRADVIHCVQQKAAGAAGRIENALFVVRRDHFHHELNDFARGEKLPHIPLEVAAEKLLKGEPFHVQVGLVEANSLQVVDNREQSLIVNFNVFRENFRVLRFGLLIQRLDPFRNGVWPFARFNLKIVGFAVAARLLLVSDFNEENFGEFVKRVGRG